MGSMRLFSIWSRDLNSSSGNVSAYPKRSFVTKVFLFYFYFSLITNAADFLERFLEYVSFFHFIKYVVLSPSGLNLFFKNCEKYSNQSHEEATYCQVVNCVCWLDCNDNVVLRPVPERIKFRQ
jgi:hypothetical protein